MKTEENLAGRKKGPAEKTGPVVKKTTVASDGGYKGPRAGGAEGEGGLRPPIGGPSHPFKSGMNVGISKMSD